jgi:hypothetical protein
MLLLQLTALALVVFYVLFRIIDQPAPRQFLARFALVSVACWMAEESCILLYKFYGYSPSWSLFLDKVPLLIILIWPVIIHSAWDLASQLLHPGHKFVPLAAGAIVCTDAALLEPVAVNAGLWSWSEPGIFHVPPIGILGWGYFAFCCTFMLHWSMRPNRSKGRTLLLLLAAVVGTHLLLFTSWWGALRWVSRFDSNMFAVGTVWVFSLALVYTILRRGTGRRVQRKALLLRLPAAFFVFLLLALNAGGSGLLVVYALAFVPPYLTMMAQQYGAV